MKKKNASKLTLSLLLVAGVLAALFYLPVWLYYDLPISEEHFVFQTLEECEQLLTYEAADSPIVHYTEASADKNADALSYEEFFGFSYQSDTMKYEMFAYVFKDKESALRYFVNRTGMTVYLKNIPLPEDDSNCIYWAFVKLGTYQLAVVSGNRAYYLEAPARYVQTIDAMLAEVFSERVELSIS